MKLVTRRGSRAAATSKWRSGRGRMCSYYDVHVMNLLICCIIDYPAVQDCPHLFVRLLLLWLTIDKGDDSCAVAAQGRLLSLALLVH